MSNPPEQTFYDAFLAALDDHSFVRLTLGKFRGTGDVKKLVATPVEIAGEGKLHVVTSHARKDVTANIALEDAHAFFEARIGADFLSATLFTTARDLTLMYNKKREPQLSTAKPSFAVRPPVTHDRDKAYAVAADRPFLGALGLTSEDNRVKPSMFGKYKQICRFIEIAGELIRDSALASKQDLAVSDIGAGKGYLTFALFDYLTGTLGKRVAMTAIEVRDDLVEQGNARAAALEFNGLKFAEANSAQMTAADTDILIALHACDTASDDAIALGIEAGAALILVAPCCQHELAPQLSPVDALQGLTRFGLFKQRQADLVTDAARALLLESEGYSVKAIEFVSTEHTAKNILIAAVKSGTVDRTRARSDYEALKHSFGFKSHHLETRLKARSNRPSGT